MLWLRYDGRKVDIFDLLCIFLWCGGSVCFCEKCSEVELSFMKAALSLDGAALAENCLLKSCNVM